MYIQVKRANKGFSKFEYEIYDTENNMMDKVNFEKQSGQNINVIGAIRGNNISMTLYRTFGEKIKIGDVVKEGCGNFAINDHSGKVYYCGKKGSNFLNGIYYWTFSILEKEYVVYEIGFGRKGIYFCIYEEDTLIAVISKDVHTKKFESNYEIFLDSSDNAPLILIANIFWDISRYFISTSGEEWHTLNTWQKELKNKFDPSFISRIKQNEGMKY